ncbi:MAG: hypothetical protein ACK5CA_01695 [Cyanobacteriota bacterium]
MPPFVKRCRSAAVPVYSILNVGRRGAGKTVFLTASYLEYRQYRQERRWLWLECGDPRARQNIDDLVLYVARTGEYPPATLKATRFDLLLQQRRQQGVETVAQIRWWDAPGEICDPRRPEFLELLRQTQGCCLFLEAPLLVQQADNPHYLAKLLEPLENLGESVEAENLALPVALILTQCDRLPPQPLVWQRLQRALLPLRQQLTNARFPHQTFYSEAPILEQDGIPRLCLNRAGAPLYWLMEQMGLSPEERLHPPPEEEPDSPRLPPFPRQLLLPLLIALGAAGLGLYGLSQWPDPPPQDTQESGS